MLTHWSYCNLALSHRYAVCNKLGHHRFRSWLGATRCQAITWTNDDLLLIGLSGANVCEILIKVQSFLWKKIQNFVCKMAAFYICFNVLNNVQDPNMAIMKVVDFLAPNSSGSSVCTVLTASELDIFCCKLLVNSGYHANLQFSCDKMVLWLSRSKELIAVAPLSHQEPVRLIWSPGIGMAKTRKIISHDQNLTSSEGAEDVYQHAKFLADPSICSRSPEKMWECVHFFWR